MDNPTFELAHGLEIARKAYQRVGRVSAANHVATVRGDRWLRRFLAVTGMVTRKARRDREGYEAALKAEGLKVTKRFRERPEIGVLRIATGAPGKLTAHWANVAGLIALPPAHTWLDPPATVWHALRLIEAAGGIREASDRYRPSSASREAAEAPTEEDETEEAEEASAIALRRCKAALREIAEAEVDLSEEGRDEIGAALLDLNALLIERDRQPPIPWQPPPRCRVCGRDVRLNNAGNAYRHNQFGHGGRRVHCEGSGQPPKGVDASAPMLLLLAPEKEPAET